MPALDNYPCSGGTLDRLVQPAILVILMDGPLHGYRVAERIGRMPGFASPKPDMSGVYRFLKTMESKGLVVSSWDVSDGGPAKKTYRITESGEACLRKWIETLEHHRKGITNLLRLARRSTQHPASSQS
jgi:DNA-binding PadR family transcriptional regulator